MPDGHLGAGEWLAGGGDEHEALDLAVSGACYQSQVTHPYRGQRDDVLFFPKVWIVAGSNEIEAGLEFVGSRKGRDSLLVVRRSGKFFRPFQGGGLPQDLAALEIAQVLRSVVPFLQ